MKSILQEEKCCRLCGRTDGLERHHVFFGSNRPASERCGLTVWLCQNHHRGACGVHGREGHGLDLWLKRRAQEQFEAAQGREAFLREIGRNYLD